MSADPMACERCGQPHDPSRCPGHSRQTGLQCGLRAGWGTDHTGHGLCRKHGGNSPGGRKQGLQIATEARIRDMLAEYQPDVEVLDPHRELLEVVALTSGMRRVLTQLVGELAPFGTPAYVEYPIGEAGGPTVGEPNYRPADPAGLYGPDHKGDGKPHVLVEMLRHWTVENARASKLAIDAGIEERRVRIVEEQAEQLAVVVRAVAVAMVDRARELGAAAALVRSLTDGVPGVIREAIESSGVIDVAVVS